MTRFIIRRLLVTIPVVLGIVFIVFLLARVLPGDPCVATLGERATEIDCQEFRARFGLDQPLPYQFGAYLTQLASGDLGESIQLQRPVTELIVLRLPTTLELAFFALVFAIGVGIPLGVASAMRRNSKVDVGTMFVANIGISVPVFVLGLALAYIFSVVLKGTPLA